MGEPALEPLQIAYYCTGHGLGHATRCLEVCKYLVASGHTVVVITGAPSRVFLRELPSTRFAIRKAVLDCGAKQLDAFTVDMKGSLEEYQSSYDKQRQTLLVTEADWIKATQTDLVVSGAGGVRDQIHAIRRSNTPFWSRLFACIKLAGAN